MLARGPLRSKQGEQGQVLILALAFIAVFGVLTVAVLRLGDVVGLQHVHTDTIAASDSKAEGGAAFAAADAANGAACKQGNTGQLTMQTNKDVVGYNINACNPGKTSVLGGTGHCLLCILNQTPTTVPSTVVVTVTKDVVKTSGGDDYINGSINTGTQLQATASPGPASIYLLSGAAACPTCLPQPVKTYSTPISDPFSTLGAPTTVAGTPSGCTALGGTYLATGCKLSLSTPGTYTVFPGLWDSLSVSGKANVTVSSGVYVFTGGLTDSGQGTFSATNVTIYLACPNYGTTGQTCATSATKTGGSINFSGQGVPSIAGPGSAQYTNVNGIADVAILADPNLLDPGGVSACIGGSGCLLQVSGNGASVTGSIDTRSGGVAISGGGQQTENNGLLVANSLWVSVNGRGNPPAPGLSLTGPGTITTGACNVFDDSVAGTSGIAGSTPVPGRAIIESGCGTGSTNGVVAFNYGP
jgi:hypothetical protein